MTNRIAQIAGAGLLLGTSGVALAHPGNHELASMAAGVLHPLLGIDHLLAMLAVGVWAAQLGGNARWQLPLAFVLLLVAGGSLAGLGFAVPMVEPMIAASVLVLGLLLLTALRLPVWFGMSLLAGFALFHGVAHGGEMPATATGLLYGAGFVLATALLHGLGIRLGQIALVHRGMIWLRGAGAVLAGAGAWWLVGA